MKKFTALVVAVVMCISVLSIVCLADEENLITGDNATFTNSTGTWSERGYWNAPKISAYNGMMRVSGRTSRLSTPVLNIFDYILEKGAGTYTMTLNIKAFDDGADGEPIKLYFLQTDVDGDEWGILDDIFVGATIDDCISKDDFTPITAEFDVSEVDKTAKTIKINSNVITELYVGFQCTDSASYAEVPHEDLLLDNATLTWKELEVFIPTPENKPTADTGNSDTPEPSMEAEATAIAEDAEATATAKTETEEITNQEKTEDENQTARAEKTEGAPVWLFIVIGVAVVAAGYIVYTLLIKKKTNGDNNGSKAE